VTENINLTVQDNTAEAILGLWGSTAASPLGRPVSENNTNPEAIAAREGWKSGETVLLLQGPGCKLNRSVRNSTIYTTAALMLTQMLDLPHSHLSNHYRCRP